MDGPCSARVCRPRVVGRNPQGVVGGAGVINVGDFPMECVVLISFASWLCRSTVRALPTFLQIIKPLPRCRRAMSQLVLLHNLQLVLRMAFESVCVCVCVCAPGGGGGGGSNRIHVQEATWTTPQCRRSRQSNRTHRRLSTRHRHRLVVLLLLQWQPQQGQRSLPGALRVAGQKSLRSEEKSLLHHRVQPASLACSHRLTTAGLMMLCP